DVQRLPAQQAMHVVRQFGEIERLTAAGRTLAADRVQNTRAWRATGSASAAAWIARETGSTLSQASAALNNAQRLKQLPATREAFLSGQLSEAQTTEITTAAVMDHSAEASLLDLAGRESVSALRERCRDVRAAAVGDEDVSERIRRGRYLRHWLDRDGAMRMDIRMAPDDGAPLLVVIKSRQEKIQREARRAGQLEEPEAYAADALLSLADGAGAPKAVVHVHVSEASLERGHTIAGETCRVDGVAPITVTAAQRLAGRGVVKLIQKEGVEVQRVAHVGRVIPAHLRTALEERDPTCVVPGCDRRFGLEIDHIVPFASGGPTRLENLARLCRWHHSQKTHHGWRLYGGPGAWEWTRGARKVRSAAPLTSGRNDHPPPSRGG
ncbi:MAG: HNH endonuclease signature motif containing protein, partial [Actinomycetota bacterium]